MTSEDEPGGAAGDPSGDGPRDPSASPTNEVDSPRANNVTAETVSNALQIGVHNGPIHIHPPPGQRSTDSGRAAVPPRQITPFPAHLGAVPGRVYQAPASIRHVRKSKGEYVRRILAQRSPLLLWFGFAVCVGISIGGFVGFQFGEPRPGSTSKDDLDGAFSGLFFGAVVGAVLAVRMRARRKPDHKWPSLHEVHPDIAKVFRYSIVLWLMLLFWLCLSIGILLSPPVPASSPNATRGSDLSTEVGTSVFCLEAAGACGYQILRRRAKPQD